MTKHPIVVVIAVLLLAVGLSGCTNLEPTSENFEKDNNPWNEKDDNFLDDSDEDDGNEQETSSEPKDSDNDGYYDYEDDFPQDSNEWKDSDNDGYGDNSDKFPYDSTEWLDSDSDGYGDNSDVFPHDSSEWLDSDEDGYGNNEDAFPYDSSEWRDSDGDGIGDNSDPYPYDYDNDGYSDLIDIDKYRDVAIKISLDKFEVVDEVDMWPFGNAEVFFEIYINNRMEGRIDYNGESWNAVIGQRYHIDKWFVYNIDDDERYTDIRIVMWDDDWPLDNDAIDIDGHDETKGLSIVYDAITGTWYGDDNDGCADGREDGSWDYDDDDGILWYDIETSEVEYDKTFYWSFNWRSWSLHINIPRYLYSHYKHSDVDRSPFLYETSKMKAFVTSDDSTVAEIAGELKSLANNNGFDYYETVDFALSFVQSLEYTYDNVSVGPNDYWRFSVETLVDETGDCEDTSILFASIMEAMGYDAVLVRLPGHLAVGVLGHEGYSGTYYIYDGYRYYYCETTGTGWTMGRIPQRHRGQSATIIQVD